MITALRRIISFAVRDSARNVWLTAATVSVLTLTLLSFNALLVLNSLGTIALATVESRVDVSVHFRPEVDESRVQSVRVALLSLPEVREIEHIAPAEALERFAEGYRRDESVIASLGEIGDNPFGSTLVIRAREIEGYGTILATLDDPAFAPLIEGRDFDDREAVIGRIQLIAGRLKMIGLTVAAAFGAITLLIVFNTIRMSIYTRREEIGIMRLVGASNAFIRLPFYVQAMLWSALALTICAAVVLPVSAAVQPHLQRFFGSATVDLMGYYQASALRVFGLQLAAVCVMAVLTTKAATARYLRV